MTAAPCLWMSRFVEDDCLHHAHGWICVGYENCDDYEADEGRVA